MKTGLGWTELTELSSPNFFGTTRGKTKPFLIKCPECEIANDHVNVGSGVCTWCGFDLNEYLLGTTEDNEKQEE